MLSRWTGCKQFIHLVDECLGSLDFQRVSLFTKPNELLKAEGQTKGLYSVLHRIEFGVRLIEPRRKRPRWHPPLAVHMNLNPEFTPANGERVAIIKSNRSVFEPYSPHVFVST